MSGTMFCLRDLTPRLWLVLAVVALSGCGEERDIQQYTVPVAPSIANPSHAWHLKLEGPPEAIEQVVEEFEAFVKSVQVGTSEDGSPEWEVPEGWSVERSDSSITYAVLDTGEARVRGTVTVLPVNGGPRNDLHRNYNRWLGQVGHPDVQGVHWLVEAAQKGEHRNISGAAGEIDVFDLSTPEETSPAKRIVVAVVFQEGGPVPLSRPSSLGLTPGGMLPPGHPPLGSGSGGGRPTGPVSESPIPMTFSVPESWIPLQANTAFDQMRLWEIDVEGSPVRVSISNPRGGDLISNVSRWSAQAGTGPVTQENLEQVMQRVDVGGRAGASVLFAGPEKGVAGVIVSPEQPQWFFKLDGPTAAVVKIHPEFEAFVASVVFQQ